MAVVLPAVFMLHQQQEDVVNQSISSAFDSTLDNMSASLRQELDSQLRDAQYISRIATVLDENTGVKFVTLTASQVDKLNVYFAPSTIFILDSDFNTLNGKEGNIEAVFTEHFRQSLSPYIHKRLARKANSQNSVNTLPSGIFQYESNFYITIWNSLEDKGGISAWLAVVYPFSQKASHILADSIQRSSLKDYGLVSVAIKHDQQFIVGDSDAQDLALTDHLVRRSLVQVWHGLEFELFVTMDKAQFDSSTLLNRLKIVAAILLLLFFLVLTLHWIIQYFFLARIGALNQAARAYASGDYSFRLAPGWRDELGELNNVFNHMCAEISQAHLYLKKKLEMKLTEGDESTVYLQTLLDSLTEAVININKSGEIITFNRAAERIFGYAEKDILGKSVNVLMPFSLSIEHDVALKKANDKHDFVKRKIGSNRVLAAKRSNGEQFPVSIVVTRSERGDTTYFTGFVRDLSEIQKAEQRVREKQRILETAIHVSFQPFFIASVDGCIQELNEALCTWLGFSREELIAVPVAEFMSKKYRASIMQAFEKMRLGELQTLSLEMQFNNKAGGLVWGLLSMSAVCDGEGVFKCVVAQVADINDSKRLALQLADRNRALEQSNADLDQFAYVASHDLKSPLNAINKVISWIEEEELNDSIKQNIAIIKNRSERMLQLLNDLLSYARVGQMENVLESINIKQLAESVFEILDKPESFTLSVENYCIEVPRIPFELVLRNIMSNAIKHHDKSQGNIRILSGRDREYLIVRVIDDGPGVAVDMQKKVFEMFQTLRPRDQVEGSGMGLALVKRTVEFFGGRIDLDSDGVCGTTVIIRWPLGTVNTAE